jgi:hypothetical protein
MLCICDKVGFHAEFMEPDHLMHSELILAELWKS